MLYVYLIAGLALLVWGGDVMVKGSVSLARRFHVSILLIGIILVGFGTSTPELVASMLAVLKTPPAPGIAVGNVVGSNIVNILFILGLTALINPIKIDKKSFGRDSLFLIISVMAAGTAFLFGTLSRILGAMFVAVLIVYVIYTIRMEKMDKKALAAAKKTAQEHEEGQRPMWLAFVMAVGGIALTILGAKLMVDSSIEIARAWGISETVIGLTIVAVGTSLPELVSSVVASIRNHNTVAVGNIIGSNIYNTLFILGIVAIVAPIMMPTDAILSFWIMAAATAVFLTSGYMGGIGRKAGLLYILLYAVYVSYCYG